MRSRQVARRHRFPIAMAVVGFLAVLGSTPAAAQSQRAELGRRLQRLELAWQEADATTRARAVEPMSLAVRSFFGLDLAAAAEQLDEAWYAVRQASPPDAIERFLTGHQLVVSPAVSQEAEDELRVSLKPAYGKAGDDHDSLPVRIAVHDLEGMPQAVVEESFGQLRGGLSWIPGKLPEGDLVLTATCMVDGRPIEIGRRGIARLPGFSARLAALQPVGVTPAGQDDATVAATVQSLVERIGGVAEGREQEIDFPIARLLAFAERLVTEPRGAIAEEARAGDVWLTLAVGRDRVPVRLRAPAEAVGPLPVLVLLHGAGGSENMFFETCGAGRAVTLGLERGWLVVAPRQGLFGLPGGIEGILAVLAEEFSIDRTRVFLVGHSMGAMQAARQVGRAPGSVAAAVALGGGGTVPTTAASLAVPWFVAAGEQDFGRRGAEGLAAGITAAGGQAVSRTYADVEHMVIVQAALDDVFAFLDDVAQSKNAVR